MKDFLTSTADKVIDGTTRVADFIVANDDTRQKRSGLKRFPQFILWAGSFIGSFFALSTMAERSLVANDKALEPDPNGIAYQSATALVTDINRLSQNNTADKIKLRTLTVKFHDVVLLDPRLSDRQVVDLFNQLPKSIQDDVGRFTVQTPLLTGGLKAKEDVYITTTTLKTGRGPCLVSHRWFDPKSTDDFNTCMAHRQDSPFETGFIPLVQSAGVTTGLALGTLGMASIYRRRHDKKLTP
jgi:hypothetical protein